MKTIGDTRAEDAIAADSAETTASGGTFLLENFLPHELSVTAGRTTRLLARRFEVAFGLSLAEWRVIAVMGRFGTMTPSTVAERTDMDKVKVSRATASLVAVGLLEQGPAPHDGRARLLRLTRKGRLLHDSAMPLALAMEAQLAAGLSEAEWSMLRTCLRRLQEHMRSLEHAALSQTTRRHAFGDPFAADG